MGWDGAGNYTRQRNFSADASAGIKILASAVDQEFNDVASAMGLCWTRNGQNTPTTDIPMGGFKFTNIGAPVSVNNYMRPRDFIENVPIYMLDTTSSADNISVSAEYFTSVSALQSPVGGTHVLIKMAGAKGSAPAMHINAGGGTHSANIVLNDGGELYSGALLSGGIYEFVFASAASVWHVMNPSFLSYNNDERFGIASATPTSTGVIEIATTAETSAGTDTFRAVTPATLNAVIVDALDNSAAFTGTAVGLTSAQTASFEYTRLGSHVVLLRALGGFNGTSNSSAFTMSGLPAAIDPNVTGAGLQTFVVGGAADAKITGTGLCRVSLGANAGIVAFGLYANGASAPILDDWAASGSKALGAGWSIMYRI